MNRSFSPWAWALAAAAALAFPLVAGNNYLLSVMTSAFIVAISALGLNLLTGYTGQLNLAHGGFMAVGAYAVGILCVDHGWPYWGAFVAAIVVTCVLGSLVGLVCLRLTGHYFSIFTLCVGYIMYLLIEKWESLTHGTVGVMGIPAPAAPAPVNLESPLGQYYLALAVLAACTWLVHRIVNSLVGRSFIAVRNSDALAEAMGVPLMRTKLLSFVLSVGFAAVAGALYAGQVRFIGPEMANAAHTFDVVMFVLVGGLGTVAGPLLGTVLVTWVTQWMQFLQDYRMLVFGPALILLLIFMPHGIVGGWLMRRARRAHARAMAAAPPPAERASRAGAQEQRHA